MERATKVLSRIRGGIDVTAEIEEIERIINEEREKNKIPASTSPEIDHKQKGTTVLQTTLNIIPNHKYSKINSPQSDEGDVFVERDERMSSKSTDGLSDRDRVPTSRLNEYEKKKPTNMVETVIASLVSLRASIVYLHKELLLVPTTRRALLVGCGLQAGKFCKYQIPVPSID